MKDVYDQNLKKVQKIFHEEAEIAFKKYHVSPPYPKLLVFPKNMLHNHNLKNLGGEAHLRQNEIWFVAELLTEDPWIVERIAKRTIRHELAHIIAYKKALEWKDNEKDMKEIDKDLGSGICGDIIALVGGRKLRA